MYAFFVSRVVPVQQVDPAPGPNGFVVAPLRAKVQAELAILALTNCGASLVSLKIIKIRLSRRLGRK